MHKAASSDIMSQFAALCHILPISDRIVQNLLVDLPHTGASRRSRGAASALPFEARLRPVLAPSLRPRGDPRARRVEWLFCVDPFFLGRPRRGAERTMKMKTFRSHTQNTGTQVTEGSQPKKHPPRAQLTKLVLEAIRLLAPILKIVVIIHDAIKG